jgi:hypothetical protein
VRVYSTTVTVPAPGLSCTLDEIIVAASLLAIVAAFRGTRRQ